MIEFIRGARTAGRTTLASAAWKTASGATAVQVVRSSRRGSRDIEHLGSAHDEAELEAPRAAVRHPVMASPVLWVRSLSRVPAWL
jgi:hypothetical protein